MTFDSNLHDKNYPMRTTFASKRNKFYTFALIGLKYVNNRDIIIIDLPSSFLYIRVSMEKNTKKI